MKKRLIVLGLIIYSCLEIYAQIDTEFWFVAPAITKNHCGTCAGAAPVSIVFTTYDLPSTITISQPKNDISINPTGFVPITITIPANSTQRVELWGDGFQTDSAELQTRKNIENWPDPVDPTLPRNRGILIQATNYISAYYIVEEGNNSDIFALKGKNALGSEFYVPFQENKHNNYWNPATNEPAYSAIDIVAVDNGTTEVVIYPGKDTSGDPKEVLGWGSQDSIVVTLEKGQTISIIPGYINGSGNYVYNRNGEDHLSGTRIKVRGGKRVAVTMKDDSVHGDSGCYDLVGDQLVPVEANDGNGVYSPIIGTEYIVMKGDLAGDDRTTGDPTDLDLDRLYILATESGTNVTVTDITLGGSTTFNNIDEGEQVMYEVDMNSGVLYVESDDVNKPIYVLHITGGGHGCEIGGAVLPTVSRCTGSFKVGFVRDQPQGSKDFYLNILARDNSLDSFKLNGVSTGWSAADFVNVPGTSWWAGRFKRNSISPLTPYLLENTVDIFHLGIMHGGTSNGGNYGYFSNYATIKAESFVQGEVAQPNKKLCFGDEAQLVASGGRSYQWYPGTYLDDSLVSSPICRPLENIKYFVIVSGASCAPPDTSEVKVVVFDPLDANFSVSETQGCAPLEIDITNNSVGAITNSWFIEELDNDTTYFMSGSKNPSSPIFNNTGDSALDFSIKLVTYNGCSRTFFRNIRVYPEIVAGYTLDINEGCDPLEVNFTDNSTGNLDKFFWEFGDGNGLLDTVPTYTGIVNHTFTNRGTVDTTYTAWLVTQSPFLCKDSMSRDILVHPYIDVKFGADTVTRCSPFTVNLYNSTVGASSYELFFGDGKDTTFVDFEHLLHTYTNTDTIIRIDSMLLVGESTQGCVDTFMRLVTIYPEINSQFSLSTDEVCDSTRINFNDLSYGHDFSYVWDFGDGNTSVQRNPSHLYRNTLEKDTNYLVSLKLESPYCTDIHHDTVNVHNIVNAGFSYLIENECTPISVKIDPGNTKGDTLYWDFNGDNIIDSTLFNKNVFYKTFENNNISGDINQLIKLRASNYGCADSLKRPITIRPKVVSVIDNVSALIGCSPTDITFSNLSAGGDLSYYWEFDDGTTVSDSIPLAHRFNNTSKTDREYNVKLKASHPVSLCSSEDSVSITIYPFVSSSFTQSIADICSPLSVDFNNTSTKVTNEAYEWNMGDGNTLTSIDFTHVYANNTKNTILNLPVSLRAYISTQPQCSSTYIDTVTIYPKVVADYNLDFTEGCNPLQVSFSDDSYGAGLKYKWDFDDATNSSILNPFHTFINLDVNDRLFDINLEVKDTNNCVDDTTIQVLVYPNVESGFTVDIADVCSPFQVNITNNSTKATGETYEWNLGDGFTTTNTDVIHTYENNSTNSVVNYPVQLRSYLSAHPLCESFSYDTIEVYPKVIADFKPDAILGCHPFTVNFTESSKGFNLDYYWDFDNGITGTSANPTYKFENFSAVNKTFNVKLKITDELNCSDDTIIQVVTNPFVNANFSYEKLGLCTPFNVKLYSGNTKGNRYVWDYDGDNVDDETLTASTAFNHLYDNASPNSYVNAIPRLITYYDFAPACKDTSSAIIAIPPRVKASFTPDALSNCQPFEVNFTNNSTGGSLSHNWNFGDTTTSSVSTPSHIYYNLTSDDKTLPVSLTTVGDNNCTDDTIINLTVYAFVESDFKVAESAKCSPFTTQITNSSKGGISSYKWDFDNGDESTSENANTTYVNTSGAIQNPEISLVAFNEHLCSDTSFYKMTVYPEVVPDFNVNIEGCQPFDATFTNSTLFARDYKWQFGDGSSSSEKNPTHRFYNFDRLLDSVFNVSLTSKSKYNCIAIKDTFITVHPNPLAVFDVSNALGCPPFSVDFINNSLGADLSYSWKLGDGNTETIRNPGHIYTNPTDEIADYEIIYVASTAFGCTDTSIKQIRVYPDVKAGFTADVKEGCSPLIVSFTNISENQDYSEWDFNDGLFSSVSNDVHRFVNSDKNDRGFAVKLTSRSNYNCFAEVIDTITVFPSPSVEFSVDPPYQSFAPEPPDVEITNWSNHLDTWDFDWDFGDGNVSDTPEKVFEKIYTIWGKGEDDTLAIKLVATNPNHTQCRSEITRVITIVPPLPEIDILGPEPEGCVPLTVNFSTASDYANGYKWTFDDGNTSTQENPVHIFDEPGVYNVKIEVDGDGGTNYDYKTVVVNRLPEVNFVVKPEVVLLPAQGEDYEPVYFYNQVKYGEKYRWIFGDGNTSTEEEPTHIYKENPDILDFPYNYDVTLIAYTEEGCVDSLTLHSKVSVEAIGQLRFPNAFSPNPAGPNGGDYDIENVDNSVFHPYHEGVDEYHLEVYTRWGEVIFSTDNINKGWDGYYQGNLVSQGVYVWKAWGIFVNNKEFVDWGDVTVLHNFDQNAE